MKKETWVGDPPVRSSKPVVEQFKETDDDGSIWFVAIGAKGELVERALLVANGKLLAGMQKEQTRQKGERTRQQQSATTLEAIKQKRLQGLALTPAEQQQALDALLGL